MTTTTNNELEHALLKQNMHMEYQGVVNRHSQKGVWFVYSIVPFMKCFEAKLCYPFANFDIELLWQFCVDDDDDNRTKYFTP